MKSIFNHDSPIRWLVTRITVFFFMLVALQSVALAAPPSITPYIKYDQFGYLPNMRKVATVVDPHVGSNASESFVPGTGANQYEVRSWSNNSVVYKGTLTSWRNGTIHAQSGDKGWYFDFSSVTSPGSYYIFDTRNKVGSGRFEIGKGVYNNVLKHAVRTFFYQRLNMAKVAPYADAKWTDAAAYERAGQDRSATSRWSKGNVASARNLSGGWMDAGDTNKYTTFAQNAVLHLLDAYRANPTAFGDNFGIPESGNGLSDLLDEIKWELEFLKRMQNATGNGGLFLKVGVDNHNDVSPPSIDTRPRYYLPECTSATLAGSAMFAAASRVYVGIASQVSYANDLLLRAESAWVRARTTTSNFSKFEIACDDGDIKSGDADVGQAGQLQSALIAAIYLYQATGKAEYRTFIESRYSSMEPMSTGWWGPYTQPLQAALLRYAGMSGVTSSVASAIRTQKSGQNGVMSLADYRSGTDLYRAYLPDAQYHWGHNMVRANVGNINHDFANFNLNTADANTYKELAAQHLHWLHGNNPLGLAMLSNMRLYGAEKSANEIYHTWFSDNTIWDNALTSPNGPAPGYLVGGPNRSYSGSVLNISNQPSQKAYRDWNTGYPENSWELSEPGIYYQAAYVQLLARLMSLTATDTQLPTAPKNLISTSTPSTTGVSLSWNPSTDNVGVVAYDLYNGETLLATGLTGTKTTLNKLTCGTNYTFSVRARDVAGNTSAASNKLSIRTAACLPATITLYNDVIGSNWADWSWSATRNFANTTSVKVGSRSIRADLLGWGALSLRHASGITTNSNTKLTFWVYAPAATTLRVSIQTQDNGTEMGNATIKLPANKWTSVSLTRAQLGNPALLKRVNLQLGEANARTVYFDQIVISQ